MNYRIHDAKVGFTQNCGPWNETIVASICYSKGDTAPCWLHCVEVEGIPAFYKTDKDVHARFIANDPSDEIFWDQMNEKCFLRSFEGVPLGEYEDIFEGFKERDNSEVVTLLRYLILLVRCGEEEIDPVIAMGKGKTVSEMIVPPSDIEEDLSEPT